MENKNIKVDGLGPLADPKQFTDKIEVQDVAPDLLRQQLADMILIRVAEEEIAEMSLNGVAGTPCHLAIGQEAIPVGVSACLTKDDRVFGAHRSHGHYLAMGGDLDALMAEVLGKATGCSKGMGGSMHLYAGEQGFAGSVPIVGATVPLAVGAAMAAKMDGNGHVAVAYFGDGTCEEGVVHESLNLAVTHDLPVLFVVENNLFSSHMDIHLRQQRFVRFQPQPPQPCLSRRTGIKGPVQKFQHRILRRHRVIQSVHQTKNLAPREKNRGRIKPDAKINGRKKIVKEIGLWQHDTNARGIKRQHGPL